MQNGVCIPNCVEKKGEIHSYLLVNSQKRISVKIHKELKTVFTYLGFGRIWENDGCGGNEKFTSYFLYTYILNHENVLPTPAKKSPKNIP